MRRRVLIASHETAEYIATRAKRGNIEEALQLLRRPRKGEPAREGDELPEGWKARPALAVKARKPRRATRSKSRK